MSLQKQAAKYAKAQHEHINLNAFVSVIGRLSARQEGQQEQPKTPGKPAHDGSQKQSDSQ